MNVVFLKSCWFLETVLKMQILTGDYFDIGIFLLLLCFIMRNFWCLNVLGYGKRYVVVPLERNRDYQKIEHSVLEQI